MHNLVLDAAARLLLAVPGHRGCCSPPSWTAYVVRGGRFDVARGTSTTCVAGRAVGDRARRRRSSDPDVRSVGEEEPSAVHPDHEEQVVVGLTVPRECDGYVKLRVGAFWNELQR